MEKVPSFSKLPESIKVLVRVRPLNNEESFAESSMEHTQSNRDPVVEICGTNSIKLSKFNTKKVFECCFDSVMGASSSQADVYKIVEKCTSSVLEGTNSTIFAYGQTGSGKTFSMYGPSSSDNSSIAANREETMGIIPRVIKGIFELASSVNVLSLSVYCSFVQIYNENLYDMLRDVDMTSPLSLREEAKRGDVLNSHGAQSEIYVQGLSEFCVKSVKETLLLLSTAERNRKIRETTMNLFSSRSHSIFQIFVEQRRIALDGGEVSLISKFNLVDLAGSEKWKPMRDKDLSEEHVTELTNINLSLHTLGRCISALASRALGKGTHVPYRDSKLTRLLQDSLGGNARTYLIATISPSRLNIDESISTLKFADRAKQVMVTATVNEMRPVDHILVQKLIKEVEYLKRMLKEYVDERSKLLAGTACPPSQDDIRSDRVPKLISSSLNLSADDMWSRAVDIANMAHGEHRSILGDVTDKNQPSVLCTDKSLESVLIGRNQGKKDLVVERRDDVIDKEKRIREENIDLKKEIDALRARHLHDRHREEIKTKAELKDSKIEATVLHQSKVAYQSLLQRENATWKHIENLQAVMNSFFKFEAEEEDMNSRVHEIFKDLEFIRMQRNEESLHPLPALALSTTFDKMLGSGSPVETSNRSGCLLPSLSSPSRNNLSRTFGGENSRGGSSTAHQVASGSGGYQLRDTGHTSGSSGRTRAVFESVSSGGGQSSAEELDAERETKILKELRETKNKIRQQQELLRWVRERDLKLESNY